MNKKRILIAISDKKSSESLGVNLKKSVGTTILSAYDGASALETALEEKPDMVIADVDIPLIPGERLFQILKNNPQTRDIPFIFISESNVEIDGFRRDMDGLLIKPFNINEACLKIKKTLAHTTIPFGNVEVDKEIEGKLSHLSLSDLLQILSLNRKEGLLKVSKNKDNIEGKVYIKDGEIYNAVLGNLEKEKALFRMLTWEEGNFEFHPQSINMPKGIKTSTNNLLIEGLRQFDEWVKNKANFPKEDSLLQLKVSLSNLPKGLKPIIYEILHMIDFYPEVSELVDHLPYTDLYVYKTLASLIKKGALEETASQIEGVGDKGSREFLSSYQVLKILERLSSSVIGEEELGYYGKILLLSLNPSLIKIFMNGCKGLPGISIEPSTFESLNNRDFFGETGTLKIGESTEIVFFALPPDEKLKPLSKVFLKNTIGAIFLWDTQTLENASDSLKFKVFLKSLKQVPLVNIYLSEEAIDDDKKVSDIKRKLTLDERERFHTLSVKEDSDKILWILYNLFGSFLRE